MTDIDISPEAVDRLANRLYVQWYREDSLMVSALSSALQQCEVGRKSDADTINRQSDHLDGWINRCASMDQTIVDLRDALTQSRAETAAAYEAAAEACKASYPSDDDYDLTVPVERFACDTERATVTCCQIDIRALTTPDQSAALAAIVSAAEDRGRETGMREAADMVNWTQYDRDTRDYFKQRILAAILKGGV